MAARIHLDILSNAIKKEVSLGHTLGPFRLPSFKNFTVSALGVRPKKSGGHRIVLDLLRPADDSVNGHVDKTAYSLAFCTIHDAVRLLTQAAKGAIQT